MSNTYSWSGNGETLWDWLDAVNAESGTGYAGHNDWRIPNVRELQSIVDYGRFEPSLDPIFGPTIASSYWSSTTYTDGPLIAWFVYFFDGFVSAFGKNSTLFVRAVRGGSK